MKIFHELRRAVEILNDYPGNWALCGGVAASIYRKNPRFTNDIDFALIDSEKISAKSLAVTVSEKLGYKAQIGFFEEPTTNKLVNGLICARLDGNDDLFVGLDFLLPVQNWIEPAVKLAQNNRIDFGFALLPTITPECLIIAKFNALCANPERFQDLDDLKNIANDIDLNYDYLKNEIKKLGMEVPPEIMATVFKSKKLLKYEN